VLQGFFHVLLGVGEGNDADDGGLPDVMEVHFGNGDIEFAAKAIFEAAKDLTLVLERVGVGEAEFESEEAYGHCKESIRVQKYKSTIVAETSSKVVLLAAPKHGHQAHSFAPSFTMRSLRVAVGTGTLEDDKHVE
jgi:hypothetical protein